MLNYIDGNLITLALEGTFDVISHGCNCMCNMRSGIAPQMATAFGVDRFPLEHAATRGDINKLGQIDFEGFYITENGFKLRKWILGDIPKTGGFELVVVNSYTQYIPSRITKPLDYEALTLCMRKINHNFKGKKIGLPKIGAGLAGGDWAIISESIERELKDCSVTIVNYVP